MGKSKHFIVERLSFTILAGVLLFGVIGSNLSSAYEEFPQKNAWTRATPSVVWCNDPNSTTTLEVHIVGRDDVARVWFSTYWRSTFEEERMKEGWIELFDDGKHGDQQAGDNVFTLSDVFLLCKDYFFIGQKFPECGWAFLVLLLRVELNDGTQMGHNYGTMVGLVDRKYKDTFQTIELDPSLSATTYAFFIEDSNHQVIDNYPVASVYCGKGNYEAYRKLYSVLPDAFDMALLMPGMQIFRPDDLGENVPYCVLVSNAVQHIGMSIKNDTARFGSLGRLKSAIYQSFASIGVFDHEIAHTWGAAIGQSLGLIAEKYKVNQGHWDSMTDIGGQLGAYYSGPSGRIGHFGYRGDETWELISNRTIEPYCPLELYMMGLIPPEEVPPIHILHSPDTNDIKHITAASYETITIEDIITAEGGERIPSAADSQKDFNLAFIVTQDIPYNDAAYAFFSLISYQLTSKEEPTPYSSLAPFYWATGGRATLETRLPIDLPDPSGLPGMPDLNDIETIQP